MVVIYDLWFTVFYDIVEFVVMHCNGLLAAEQDVI